jgi:hypothetical protein
MDYTCVYNIMSTLRENLRAAAAHNAHVHVSVSRLLDEAQRATAHGKNKAVATVAAAFVPLPMRNKTSVATANPITAPMPVIPPRYRAHAS